MSAQARITLVHASVGSGHRIAAESIAAQIETLSPDTIVEVLDVLAYGRWRVSGDAAASAFTGPTAPLYNLAWGSPALGRASMAFSGPVLSAFYRRFAHHLAENRPSVVVATHALGANLAVRAMRRADVPKAPVVAAATDYGLHGYWPHSGLALFCVADDAEAQVLARRGAEAGEVAVTGIPVRPQFASAFDREAALERFDLPRNRRILLALAGATMPGPYVRFKESLATTLPAIAGLPDTAVAVVTGRDDAFAETLRTRVQGFGSRNVRVLGYVERMAEIMAAADLAICKPGGLVTAECVAVGLPMVLVGPAAGQERANVSALLEAGAAVYDADPRRLAEAVRGALASQSRLARMREAAARLAKPDAARDIAERVLELAGVRTRDRGDAGGAGGSADGVAGEVTDGLEDTAAG
jgi:processive 1,2-diacylglycerol beta-glucosyltransferase